MGNGEGHTVVVLTDAESRLLRELLCDLHDQTSDGSGIDAFNRGIARGTAKLAEEFAAGQKAKRK